MMQNEIEIVMDIDTLEIFEVIDNDQITEEIITELEEEVSSYDSLNRILVNEYFYHNPKSVIWQVAKKDIFDTPSPKNKHGPIRITNEQEMMIFCDKLAS